MAIRNPYSSYASNAIETASPEELTLRLYEGALKFCNQAIIAVENSEIERAHSLIIRVQDIIREFQITLDMQYEISNELDLMYDYLYRRLVEANISKDIEILEEVRDFLRQFRDMWKEAMVLAKNDEK